jgi:AraC-like DNA-binding protein
VRKMLYAGENTLLDAVGLSIDRIRQGYRGDWVIFDSKDTMDEAKTEISGYQDENRKYIHLFESEYHSFTELCFCLDGCFALQLSGNVVELHEGHIFPILPGIIHNELPRQNDEYTAIWISVDFNRVVLHLSGIGSQTPFSIYEGYVFRPDYEYIRLIDCIRTEIENKKVCYSDIIKAELLKLFISVYRELKNASSGKQNTGTWKESIVREVICFIKDNYSKYIRLADISQKVCISPNYLNSIFKSVIGKTIMQYHEDYRIDIAKSLLRDPGYSINDISRELGFYDQYHFSKVFKKETRMSPFSYRRQP